ncbi:MAG: hypothetical protein PVI30_02035 [Myxococcales bacterium]|jgi:hypothetical protein
MSAHANDTRPTRPGHPTSDDASWSVTRRQQAYREARHHGLVVAPPLNPPPELPSQQ